MKRYLVNVIIENKPYVNDPEGETILKDLIAGRDYQSVKSVRTAKMLNIIIETNLHPHPDGAYGFRVEIGNNVITYITDIEHPPGNPLMEVSNLARNSDLLIHEAHFTPTDLPNFKNWGHSSWEEAVGVAKAADAKQLVLYHHSPFYDDKQIDQIEIDAKKAFSQTVAARESLTINIPAI